jgi:hypothetical protein
MEPEGLQMASQTKVLSKQKETKGTVVYGSKDADAAVGVVYVAKAFLGEPIPETIELTVKVG